MQARAEARRLQTRDEQWQDLVQDAWRRAQDAAAAGDDAAALRWLGRAHRILPHDGTVAFALASARLKAGDLPGAAALFQMVAERHALPEGWAGLAACRLLLGDAGAASTAAARAVQAAVWDPALGALAAAVAEAAVLPGWCALDGDGGVYALPGSRLTLDGVEVPALWTDQRAQLPPGWQRARLLHVDRNGAACLGSPLPVAVLTAISGLVDTRGGEVIGWAWHPADPGRDPVLFVNGTRLTATEPDEDALRGRPLARPRRFSLAASGPVAVRDVVGRHLRGSPVDPGLDWRNVPMLADTVPPTRPPASPAARTRLRAADVVVPVYGGGAQTLACLDSVVATVPPGTRIWVVDDASPDPDLAAALDRLAAAKRIRLIRLPENLGFPGAANAGLRASAPRDAVLLNSDTLVPPGWLARLRDAAYSSPDVGTATPLSNDGTIMSYPDHAGGNPVPDAAGTAAVDALAQQSGGDVIDVPTGVGFCLYLRRDCLDETGLFREDCFAQGYGEENDLCLRARHLGWRNVAATGVFVGHVGGQSFGAARHPLLARNLRLLNRLHPGYDALVQAHAAADPLLPTRRRMDALRWTAGRAAKGAVLMVTHAGGGGVDRVVADRAAAHAAAGLRPIVIRPIPGGCRVESPGLVTPNLRFRLPAELPELQALLRPDRPRAMELHHLLGHDPSVLGLRQRTPMDVVVHDYAAFCQRIALVSTGRRYCGEPALAGCEACIADLGTLLHEDIAVPDLLARSAMLLRAARRVIAPCADAAVRIARHFPGIRPAVEQWGDDGALPPLAATLPGPVRRVCVVGAIGVEKGYEVLLACVRDARARGLPLEFVVVGYTSDDVRLMAAGPVFVTGEYAEADGVTLIRAQGAHLAFIPSVWPETWCFALTAAWEAGLAAAAFDLGAPAERIRATGRGWVWPAALGAGAINDLLLRCDPARLAPAIRPTHSTNSRIYTPPVHE